MNVRCFVQTIEAAEQQFLPSLESASQHTLRQELKAELQQLEAIRISEGQHPHAARKASWKQVKVLHGLGYPIDFEWLHAADLAAQAC